MDFEDFAELAAARDAWAAGRVDDALDRFRRAAALRPHNVRGLLEGGRALLTRYCIDEGVAMVETALELAGADERVAAHGAQTYRGAYRLERAIAVLERQLELAGDLSAPLWGELAVLYELVNRVDAALESIARCVQQAPQQGEPRLVQLRLLRRSGDVRAAEELAHLLLEQPAPPLLHARVWSEVCELRDREGDFFGAAAAIDRAKQWQRSLPDVARLQAAARRNQHALLKLTEEIDAARLRRWGVAGDSPDEVRGMAHLIGFPRCGTTLLEQILAAHPEVADAAERPVFTREILPAMLGVGGGRLDVQGLDALGSSDLRELRRRYIRTLGATLDRPWLGQVLLDKNPNHTALVAPLFRLWPDSRFLFAVRDPRDVFVSVYHRLFPLTEFSVAFLDPLATAALYGAEMQLWRCWKAKQPHGWQEVRYEQLTADPAGVARAALAHLGLEWDPQVLDFQQVAPHRAVHSPSHEAVRRPIDAQRVGRWRGYRACYGPVFDRLDEEAAAWGYEV